MDVITFEIGDVTIQLVNGTVHFWYGSTKSMGFEIPIDRLQDALSTARMLRKDETK